mgnify:FL=1
MVGRVDPGCGNLVSLAQFLFVAAEGLFSFVERAKDNSWLPIRLKQRTIPLRYYLSEVGVFVVVSIINNVVFKFKIPMPLHMIFRSGSLFASVFLGMCFFRKHYSPTRIVSVLAVSTGIFIATWSSGPGSQSSNVVFEIADPTEFSIGIGMLTVSLFLSAWLGNMQEASYRKFGKVPLENMFYCHFLALPFFVFTLPDVYNTILHWNGDQHLYALLLLNVVTQYACIRGVFALTGLTTTLTCTFVLSIRKFLSLLFSVYYFSNPFTLVHWMAATLVFGGSILFGLTRGPSAAPLSSDVGLNKKEQEREQKKKKKNL